MLVHGADGALLTTDGIDGDWDYNVYFAGRQIWQAWTIGSPYARGTSPDRLGSTVKHFPYGDEPTTTAPNREKFATYFRDEVSTLDYARNRYYSSTIARFTTADPYGPSARPGAPQTWNRYSYVGGDPVNRNDPSGLEDIYDLPWFPNWGLIYALAPNTNFFWVTGTAPMPNSPHASAFWGAFGSYTGGPADLQVEPDGPSSSGDPYWFDSLLSSIRDRAITLAMSRLVPGSPCWDLFNVGGAGPSPIDLLRALGVGNTEYGAIRYGDTGSPSRSATTQPVLNTPGSVLVVAALITLNSDLSGAWFEKPEADQAATILHELGHVYQILFDASSTALYDERVATTDSARNAISAFNTALVKEKCF